MTKVIEIGIKNWLLFISMMPIKILKFLTENLSKYEQFTLQRNLYKADTIGAKKMSALKRCSLNRDFFEDIVWPQSKAIRSLSCSPSCGGVHFIACPLYRDSTVIALLRYCYWYYYHYYHYYYYCYFYHWKLTKIRA